MAACALSGQAGAAQPEEARFADDLRVAALEAGDLRPSMPAPGERAIARTELRLEKRGKGAPYCADAVHETIRPLSDGNRIVHSQTRRICRDGEGRTRQEVERDGQASVYLRDPVSREQWLLDTEARTARQLTPPILPALHPADSTASAAMAN